MCVDVSEVVSSVTTLCSVHVMTVYIAMQCKQQISTLIANRYVHELFQAMHK
jgi:hypothetical protein